MRLLREQGSRPVLDKLHAYLIKVREELLPQSEAGQAVNYVLKNWTALTRYCGNPNLVVSTNGDPVEWLERELAVDPWETGDKLVAGISSLDPPQADRPRNCSRGFVLGACPNPQELEAELWQSPEVARLLEETERGRIAYWYRRKVGYAPKLYPEVMEECATLMGYSIRQALAGPRENCEPWIGQPVWKRVGCLYCEHLNRRNKQIFNAESGQRRHREWALRNDRSRKHPR